MQLNARELEIIRLLRLGHTNKEIGKALSLSQYTVRDRISAMMGHVGVKNRAGLATAHVVPVGLISEGQPDASRFLTHTVERLRQSKFIDTPPVALVASSVTPQAMDGGGGAVSATFNADRRSLGDRRSVARRPTGVPAVPSASNRS